MKKILYSLMLMLCVVGCQNTQQKIAGKSGKIHLEKQEMLMAEKEEQELPFLEEEIVAQEPTDTTTSENREVTTHTETNTSASSSVTPIPQQVTIQVECRSILQNKSKLKAGYEEFVPSDGIIISSVVIEIKEEDTVLHILKRVCEQQGVAIDVQGSYVKSVHHIAEFCCGEVSGWMYGVNGEYVSQAANKKKVKHGDVIKWVFSCSNGKDVTF